MVKASTVFALLFAFCQNAGLADDQTAANELLNKVLKAHGGEAALGKPVACEVMVKVNTFRGNSKTLRSCWMICQGVDKQRTVVFGIADSLLFEVNNGDKGWTKVDDNEATPQSDGDVKFNSENGYLNWITTVFPLKQKEYKLSLIDEISVNGEPAVGMLVHREKHDDVKLYFDKKNQLLVKFERSIHVSEARENVVEVQLLSDYRTVQGIKQPFKVVTYWDGELESDAEIVELKFHEKPLDDKLFEEPKLHE